ncbi:hypothetical protein J5S49_13370 [Virgibacillus halodenitrificans]|uniref:hypothetical protein n=1 Tax=Virgibacillus halodenitrificans TaxID=1482 RepID=UPI001F336504|nr:hypothetical protein [Virgibacillus halodenitrificans]MCG1029281.1 hypothetical protein [Virgibacillus halodenitrificans]
MKLSMFLIKDQEEAKKLLDAYDYNMRIAAGHILKGEFKKASIYHQNMAHELEQLNELKASKKTIDKINLQLKQIDGEQKQKEFFDRTHIQRLSK